MCHIPVFCWITATVLEDLLKSREGGELPKSLTEMYIHFLVVQAKVKKVKYDGGAETDPHWSPESRKMMESLGKLAFEQLQKGNLIFYESDLTECDIDIRAASVYSGVFTQIFREERGLYQDKMFCFIHLSVQEFLAALHVHLTFITSGVNLMEEEQKESLIQFYQSAVNKALQSPNGHLDLFLRFLLGLSLQTNQSLLQGLLTQTGSSSQTNQETVQYIKEKISENLSTEKSINLFHCLNELNDGSLVEEIQQFLSSGRLSTDELSPAQWSALVFILLSSEEDLEVFDLQKYSASEEALLRLLPVIKASNKALLSGCKLSERSCVALSSVLSSQSSSLRDLDLSNNNLLDSGVKLLSSGLESPHCELETLRSDLFGLLESPNLLQPHYSSLKLSAFLLCVCSLSGCLITEEGCASLASALKFNPSHLRELDLSYNHPGEGGMKPLLAQLENPHWRLNTVKLSDCDLSERSCAALSSVLSSKSSRLRDLDLSDNKWQDSGIKLLSAGLGSPYCELETLRSGLIQLFFGCKALGTALKSNSYNLTELDLSQNNLLDSGFLHLRGFLESSNCRLQTLRSVNKKNSLKNERNLSGGEISDASLEDFLSMCHFTITKLKNCSLSEISWENLGSALKSNPSNLTDLDLSGNNLQDSGFLHLRGFLESPDCRLQTLRLEKCSFSGISCEVLGSALTSNPYNLKELDLSMNNLTDSGFNHLRGFLESPHCRLQTLRSMNNLNFP
uniref:NACHT LRR and PYD domain-containing protein n=1 Tax=Oryzias melastigma TaxID=30732 RepID=A0A3B3C9S6_ORYME